MGKHSLPGYGSVASGKRPVRTRMPGGVGAGGENPRLPDSAQPFYASLGWVREAIML